MSAPMDRLAKARAQRERTKDVTELAPQEPHPATTERQPSTDFTSPPPDGPLPDPPHSVPIPAPIPSSTYSTASNSHGTPDIPMMPTAPSQPAFLSEVASIQTDIQKLYSLVDEIAAAHHAALTAIDAHGQETDDRLDVLTTETRQLMAFIKNRLQRLQSLPVQKTTAAIRRNQISLLRTKFLEALQHYQMIEYHADMKSKQKVERQLRFVKPDATSDEVHGYLEGGDQQVFAQALVNSTRYGESRQAFREVEHRQAEIRRMENTLIDLTHLFNDMGALVEQQDNLIDQVGVTAEEVTENTKKGYESTEQAVVHARRYRKGRWICFGIFVTVCCILALVLGLVFGLRK